MTPLDHRTGLRAGIIAAGRGERLQGARVPKPLVSVHGRALIDRVLDSIGEVDPAVVTIIINEWSSAVKAHVEAEPRPFDLQWLVETTPSSMHSFLRVIESLATADDRGPFLVSTVDTVAPAGAYRRFAERSRALNADLVLAVTSTLDDDRPLLVDVVDGQVRRVGVSPAERIDPATTFCTAGYYSVRPTVLQEADEARRNDLSALRQFIARLVERGYPVGAVEVPPGVDVDRPDDVDAAEALLKQVHR